MKFMTIKFLVIIMILINTLFSLVYASEEGVSEENTFKVIDSIEHNSGTLVLDDFIYKMKLNAKVYDRQNNLVNRYALRKGQRVRIEVDKQGLSGPGRFIDVIFILGN